MKKTMERPLNLRHLFLVFLLLFTLATFGQDEVEAESNADEASTEEIIPGADSAKGKELFNSLCAACHKRYKNAVGPLLHGVTERRDMDWLYKWIKNSQELIKSGDAQAVQLYEEWNKVAMNAFPQLDNQDIDNILAYVEEPKPEPIVAETQVAAGAEGQGGSGISTEIVLGLLAVVLLILSVILILVNKTLNRFAAANGIPVKADKPKGKPIWVAFAENQFLVLVSVVFLLLAVAWGGYGFLMQVGVDQGYEPIQPIHYSHRIHAGENQIECKYCHSSARVSKHSGIPSLNVCMNCHKQIAEVAPETATEEYSKEFYDNEIQKLYEATGWDTSSQSYTGETKPVKWVRIHNLPDFVYFNHSQHVTVGGIECQTCHGPVETYEIQKQYAPLTMGWCINCHRESNIKVEGNAYYEKIHEELSEKYGVEELSVAEMGGLECGKCHY
ncbi:heme-binding cytochrome, cytochrome c3 superfamily protein [Psychroflexus gondwanensis ACAM 44]|jgi:cytochrome c2/nitrate reductase NapE component|uniref:Heme-binding cytochrome, cytochrome c3 superfamily protein n=1 Tax=Psychroflexus gondwanensis ACAM 44 TaxID=1189619 RepID=N1WZC7_9FLAO|nr:c-type cytochrome [Psychroflexus gondwanensis]EMY81248.1 heme-binding cytochrome, cytochrome c3 superfamily protein [Psychroflexus gondwanensis ACAM 44]